MCLSVAGEAQDARDLVGEVHTILLKGATRGSLVVSVRQPPGRGDRFGVGTDTDLVTVSLVTPDGRRITAASAEANGFTWSASPVEPQIGSTDGGSITVIGFTRPGPNGNYTVEFASRPLPKTASVGAWFMSERDEVNYLLKGFDGIHRLGPVSLGPSKPSENLVWTLGRDERGTVIDIVVTDENARVQVSLPNGEVLTPQTPKRRDFEWRTLGSRSEFDPPGSLLGFSGLLLPREGRHHVISLAAAGKGTYRAQIQSNGRAMEAEALVLPMERILSGPPEGTEKVAKAPDGEVRMEAIGLPNGCFAGDRLELAVRLKGDAVPGPVRFVVKVETRAPLPHPGNGPQEYAPPQVVVTPVSFTRAADGWYRGALFPKNHGVMRIWVQASGTTASGRAFSSETLFGGVMVEPVVATFVSLSERVVDDNGNGRPDRLEVTATLDVVRPGKYEMRFDVLGANPAGVGGSGQAKLAAGRQKITASVAAKELFEQLKDGPYTITRIQLYRPEGNSFGNFVKTTNAVLTTGTYRREQWDRGANFGEEKVVLRPLRPGHGGKYTALEAVWEATTQGGWCTWNGSLIQGQTHVHLVQSGSFPPGRQRLAFEFDARPFAKSAKGEWHFSGSAYCQGDDGEGASVHLPVMLDPRQFDANASSLRAFSQTMMRVVIGQEFPGGRARLEVEGPSPKSVTYRLTSVPAGLKSILKDDDLNVTAGDTIAPGRYYLGFEATAGNGSGTGLVVADVVPKTPAGRKPSRSID